MRLSRGMKHITNKQNNIMQQRKNGMIDWNYQSKLSASSGYEDVLDKLKS